MSNLILTVEDIEQNIDVVLEMLFDNGKSFTAYNVTQIVRSSGVFVKHNTVKEYLNNVSLPVNYNTQMVLVGENENEAILYTNFTLELPPETHIVSDLEDFEDVVEEYLAWFKDSYHFEIPGQAEEASEEASDEAGEGSEPEVVIVFQVQGSDPIKLPMTEEGLLRLLSGELGLSSESCKCKMEHCHG